MPDEELKALYRRLESEINEIGYIEDTLKWYSLLINLPLLTDEEEKILLFQVSLGDKRARRIMIDRNLRLVKAISNNFLNCGLTPLDVIQEGNVGLIEAVDRFDLSRDTSFSTYAYPLIEGHIKRAIDEKARMIAVPVHKLVTFRKFKAVFNELTMVLYREPTDSELAEYLELDIDAIEELKRIREDAYTISDLISYENDEGDELELFEFASDESLEEDASERLSRNSILNEILMKAHLTENEMLFITLCFGLDGSKGHNQKEIAEIMNLSKQRISQLSNQSLEKLNATARRLSYCSRKIR